MARREEHLRGETSDNPRHGELDRSPEEIAILDLLALALDGRDLSDITPDEANEIRSALKCDCPKKDCPHTNEFRETFDQMILDSQPEPATEISARRNTRTAKSRPAERSTAPQVTEVRHIHRRRGIMGPVALTAAVCTTGGVIGGVIGTIKLNDEIGNFLNNNPTVSHMIGETPLPEKTKATGIMHLDTITVGEVTFNLPGRAELENTTHLNLLSDKTACTINSELNPDNGVPMAITVNGYEVEVGWTEEPDGSITNPTATIPETGIGLKHLHNDSKDGLYSHVTTEGLIASTGKIMDNLTEIDMTLTKGILDGAKNLIPSILRTPDIDAFFDGEIAKIDARASTQQILHNVVCPAAEEGQWKAAELVAREWLFKEPEVQDSIIAAIKKSAASQISQTTRKFVHEDDIEVSFGGSDSLTIKYEPDLEAEEKRRQKREEAAKILAGNALYKESKIVIHEPPIEDIKNMVVSFDFSSAKDPENTISNIEKKAVG